MQYDGNGAFGNFSRCVVTAPWKLNVDRFKDETYFELYNLSTDPQETNNLAMAQPQRTQELFSILVEHLAKYKDHLGLSIQDYRLP